MVHVNVAEAKAHLSRYLDRVLEGEVIILCRRNVPIAELRPIGESRSEGKRRLGRARGRVHVPEAFFDPLPEELLDAFEGGDPR